ncbi:MAG: hypothetical protein ACI90V_001067, partial [Bacillariaceae sp.]
NINLVHKCFYHPDKIRARKDCNGSFMFLMTF